MFMRLKLMKKTIKSFPVKRRELRKCGSCFKRLYIMLIYYMNLKQYQVLALIFSFLKCTFKKF